MAKFQKFEPKSTPTPAPQIKEPDVFSPEWMDKYKDRIQALMPKPAKVEEPSGKVSSDDPEVQEALAELGIDLADKRRSSVVAANLIYVKDLIERTEKQIEILMRSTAWTSNFANKEKTGYYYVLVFCRQLLGHDAPPGQQSRLAELSHALQAEVPEGVFGAVGTMVAPGGRKKKAMKLTEAHLRAAGVLPKMIEEDLE